MRLPIWIVDAFVGDGCSGNPAAVCLVESFPDPGVMQAIALRNRLSETAFIVREGEDWQIRWFTPAAEVDLCGHATLAAAAVIYRRVDPELAALRFESKSGPLAVAAEGEELILDFPARPPAPAEAGDATAAALTGALGAPPVSCRVAEGNLLAVLESEAALRALAPDFERLDTLCRDHDATGLIATAPADSADFASRYFAPAYGVPEDPVTGSAHCTLVPYWAARLGRESLLAHQVSPEGGLLRCRDRGERVDIGGEVRFYLEGRIEV